MDPTARLRIATRIHFALMRHFGVSVDIRALLSGAPEGQEALWVCQGSGEAELVDLARRFARLDLAAGSAPVMPAPSAATRPPR